MFRFTTITLLHVGFEGLIISILERARDDPEGVLEWSNRVLGDDPGNAHASFARGAAQLELGHYGRGIADIQNAISRDRRFVRGGELMLEHGNRRVRQSETHTRHGEGTVTARTLLTAKA